MTNSILISNNKLKYVVVKGNSVGSELLSVYLYNSKFFFLIKVKETTLFCNNNSGDLTLSTGHLSKLTTLKRLNESWVYSKLNNLLFSWDSYYFNKLIIDGKAYRITKYRRSNFKLLFGRSHRTLVITRGLFLRKKKKIKKKFMFFGLNPRYVHRASTIAKNIRPNDMYTNRGIRYSKEINRRKLGKKGSSSVL